MLHETYQIMLWAFYAGRPFVAANHGDPGAAEAKLSASRSILALLGGRISLMKRIANLIDLNLRDAPLDDNYRR